MRGSLPPGPSGSIICVTVFVAVGFGTSLQDFGTENIEQSSIS